MSDYEHNKVIRYKNDKLLEQYNVENYFELVDKLQKTLKYNLTFQKFVSGFDCSEEYVDYILESSYGKDCSEWCHIEKISSAKFLKYRKLFAEFLGIGEDDIQSLCQVDYCWYNASEPPFSGYKKYNYSISDSQQLAYKILEVFEEKLEELDISLPDEFREDSEDEAKIFGETYYDLENQIIDILEKNKGEDKDEL